MFKNLSTAALGLSGRQSEVIELALSFGFKGIDLDLADFQEQVKSKGLPHARRLLDSAKLKIGSFRLPVVWDEDDERFKREAGALSEAAELAASIGAKRCVTTLAPANDRRPYHENFEFHRRRLSDLGDLLAPHGIQLAIDFQPEPILRHDFAYQFIHSFDALAMLVGMMRSNNVGIAFDAWSWQVTGGTMDQLRKLGVERIITVALSDAAPDLKGEPNEETRHLPGEAGGIDSVALLTMLAEADYSGPVTPVPHPSKLKGLGREALVRAAGQALDKVWKGAGLTPLGKLAPPSVAKK
ncbi:MAG TPA: sugar phosphate isomerase/epimerase [Pirellulales bacterium]|jgi:sugar phosphate isomerase/epimerase|nr:sugar phosphate isomerase/epimerase [Pirellulales bacterium]